MPTNDPEAVRYVQSEYGGVHSVTQAHYDTYLTVTTQAGGTYLLPGWRDLTEAQARKAHPQLFGAADPAIRRSGREVADELATKKALAELLADESAELEE